MQVPAFLLRLFVLLLEKQLLLYLLLLLLFLFLLLCEAEDDRYGKAVEDDMFDESLGRYQETSCETRWEKHDCHVREEIDIQ